MSAAMIGRMDTLIIAVHQGTPVIVDAVVAGVRVRAEWVGAPPGTGDVVDVELDADPVLGWADTIAIYGAEATLRDGQRLRGTVEMQEEEVLTVRIADGLLLVEVDDGSFDVPPGTAITVVAEPLKLYPTGT
jgi:hypothetical protein